MHQDKRTTPVTRIQEAHSEGHAETSASLTPSAWGQDGAGAQGRTEAASPYGRLGFEGGDDWAVNQETREVNKILMIPGEKAETYLKKKKIKSHGPLQVVSNIRTT